MNELKDLFSFAEDGVFEDSDDDTYSTCDSVYSVREISVNAESDGEDEIFSICQGEKSIYAGNVAEDREEWGDTEMITEIQERDCTEADELTTNSMETELMMHTNSGKQM